MGPKKRKNIKNDFYFFVKEQKDKMGYSGDLWNLASSCAPAWNNLDSTEKER